MALEPSLLAAWVVDNPGIARGRLLTAAKHLANSQRELHQLLGYLDGSNTGVQYVELGMTEIRSQLVKAVRALDMVEPMEGAPDE